MFREMLSEWNKPLQISLETARLIHIAPEGSCERIGTRDSIDSNWSPQYSKKETADSEIYCFGGSTTFGHGVAQNESWPKYLESFLLSTKVINCGVVKNDLKASLHTFVEIARSRNIPNQIIFLDGVNESAGFKSWNPSFNKFVDYDTNYTQLQEFWNARNLPKYAHLLIFISGEFGRKLVATIQQRGIRQAFLNYLKKMKSSKPNNEKNSANDGEITVYIENAAKSYIRTKDFITLIAKALGIERTYFFLQPAVFNTPGYEGTDPRKGYLEKIYHLICEQDPDVIDISMKCGSLMGADMFFDWQHPDARGNKIIAEEIAKYIK